MIKKLLHWLNFVKRYRIKQMLKEHKELQKLFNDMSGTDDYN